jgi:hypothetical protein
MVGKGRHLILGLTSPDPVLSVVGSIGLAASVGTALVVDLVDPAADGGRRTLRDLADEGPSLQEMSPGRRGVAMIRGGGVEPDLAVDVIRELSRRWPAIVVRVDGGESLFPTVVAVPLYPGRLLPVPGASNCVWQPVGLGAEPPAPGPVLPRLRPAVLRGLLSGRLPRRSRWIDSWRAIWEMPWA